MSSTTIAELVFPLSKRDRIIDLYAIRILFQRVCQVENVYRVSKFLLAKLTLLYVYIGAFCAETVRFSCVNTM